MPTNTVRTDNMRKHLTSEERAIRQGLTDVLEDGKRLTNSHMTERVRQNPRAAEIWRATLKSLSGLKLLKREDAEIFGRYCCIAARLETLEDSLAALRAKADGGEMPFEVSLEIGASADKLIPRIESAERNLLTYAEKLGITPTGRARLAMKVAKKEPDSERDLYGD